MAKLKADGALEVAKRPGVYADVGGAVGVKVEGQRGISRGGMLQSLLELVYAVSGPEAVGASVEVMRSGVCAEADLDSSDFFGDWYSCHLSLSERGITCGIRVLPMFACLRTAGWDVSLAHSDWIMHGFV